MRKFFADFVLVSSTLIFASSVGLYLTKQKLKLPAPSTTTSRQTYVDKNGQLKYAQGTCKKDSECYPSGCSSHICSNEAGLITTCEVRTDFPNKDIYSCGCVEDFCAWYKE